MNKLAIAMTTAARRGTSYYQRSIASLRAAGITDTVHLMAEPNVEATDTADIVVNRFEGSSVLGCFKNWVRAAQHCLTLDADWILLLQDDVIWRNDASVILADARIRYRDNPAIGFLSPYTSKAMLNETDRGLAMDRTAPNVWCPVRFHDNAFWGALATMWPRKSLQAALAHPRVTMHTHHRKVDVVIGNTCRDLDLQILMHRPSLATHIGDVSTINRDAKKFPGNQWGRYGYGFREQR